MKILLFRIMDTTTSIAIENLSRTHLLSQISKINSMTAPPPVAALSPPTSTPVAKPSLILENGGPTSQPLSETFPRYSAFEKVVQSSSRKNDPTTDGMCKYLPRFFYNKVPVLDTNYNLFT